MSCGSGKRRSGDRAEKRPEWLKIRLRTDAGYRDMRRMVDELRLNTVCTEARCPNIWECWNAGTATFMILGETCTRRCGFCSVHSGRPAPGVDAQEPQHVAEGVARLGLRHVVITSVDRDDLPDGGAQHFADVINAVKQRVDDCAVEVLTPDFKNKDGALETVLGARPEVFSHNVETVPRLYREARPGSRYATSVDLLARAATRRERDLPDMRVKSSMMLGLGETDDEVLEVFADLHRAGVQVVALGQYLQPRASTCRSSASSVQSTSTGSAIAGWSWGSCTSRPDRSYDRRIMPSSTARTRRAATCCRSAEGLDSRRLA